MTANMHGFWPIKTLISHIQPNPMPWTPCISSASPQGHLLSQQHSQGCGCEAVSECFWGPGTHPRCVHHRHTRIREGTHTFVSTSTGLWHTKGRLFSLCGDLSVFSFPFVLISNSFSLHRTIHILVTNKSGWQILLQKNFSTRNYLYTLPRE